MFAPAIDNIIKYWPSNQGIMDAKIHNQLTAIYQAMDCIRPHGDDDIRKLWIAVPRGTINDLGEFKKLKEDWGVDSYEEFEKLWKDFYPDEIKWHSFVTAKYKTELFFYFDSKLIFSINEQEEPEKVTEREDSIIYEFLEWLFGRVKEETKKLQQDVALYNKYLEENLSCHKRFGRIKRVDFWNIWGNGAIRLDEQLGSEKNR